MDEDQNDFKLVLRSKKSKRVAKSVLETSHYSEAALKSELDLKTSSCEDIFGMIDDQISNWINQTSVLDYFQRIFEFVGDKNIDQMVCYGIGNFSFLRNSSQQLAVLKLLRNSLKLSSNQCLIFDPVFTKNEVNYLRSSDFNVLDQKF